MTKSEKEKRINIINLQLPNIKKGEDINKTIGQRIRNLRIKKHMSQDYLAKQIGVTFQQIQKYESGETKLTIERFIQIQKVFREEILTLSQIDYEILDIVKKLQESEKVKNILKKLNFI